MSPALYRTASPRVAHAVAPAAAMRPFHEFETLELNRMLMHEQLARARIRDLEEELTGTRRRGAPRAVRRRGKLVAALASFPRHRDR